MYTSRIRLLLVEDNPADAVLLKHALADAGAGPFQVTHAEALGDAFDRLKAESFDAVLLDLSLPDSQGLETIERMIAAAPPAPIVVLTGLEDEAMAVEAVRKGAQDFLPKGNIDGRLLARAIRYAMERKRLDRELKALNETLEQRVAERTATATRRAAQLQALASELTRAEHRERRRLAQILHDHLQQLLYAARLNLDSLRRHAPGEAPSPETIDRVDSLLGECIAESRSLTLELSPPALYEAGLAAGLEWLGRHMEQTCGLTVDVTADADAEPQSDELRVLLFEAARELLFNVVKHSGSRCAQVRLSTANGNGIELTVSDLGSGFVPPDSKGEKAAPAGFGLFSIRERLELMGGRLRIDAAPGRGTRVTISTSSAGPNP
jgi:signal transduction histidine kinase